MIKETQVDVKIHDLFPSPLGIYTCPVPFTKKELKLINSFERAGNQGNWSTKNNYIFKEKGMERIAAFCQEAVDLYFLQTIAPSNKNLKLRITQSWGNYTDTEQFHHRHSHANSFISGVFYVKTAPEEDRIFFYREKARYNITTTDFNVWNSQSWWWPSVENTLLLFPSTIEHSVESKKREDTRISISFNTFFVGEIGEENELTHLVIKE